ncbi:MAG: hypothetical protein HYX47_13310 [Burkholderiales bacterium]|nr:hypothetical protein [Burkholderiales bacterium]
MKLLFTRITAALGLAGCLFGAAEVGVLGNYYARVEDRARIWCSTRSFCKSVRREGTLAAPQLIVHVKGSINPTLVETDLRAAGALKAPRQDSDPLPKELLVVVRADMRALGGKP